MKETTLNLPDGTEIPLQDLSVLSLRPGDYLILRVEQHVSPDHMQSLKKALEEHLPEVVGRVLVFGGDIELAVLRPESV